MTNIVKKLISKLEIRRVNKIQSKIKIFLTIIDIFNKTHVNVQHHDFFWWISICNATNTVNKTS